MKSRAILVALLSMALIGCLDRSKARRDAALVEAVVAENVDDAARLIKNGANVNVSDKSPSKTPLITLAIKIRNLGLIELLISNNADVNSKTIDGNTPLMVAIGVGDDDADLVELLLKAGATVGITNKLGLSAMDYAKAAPPRPVILKLLQQAGGQ